MKFFTRSFGAGRGQEWRKTRAAQIRHARKTCKYVGFQHRYGYCGL